MKDHLYISCSWCSRWQMPDGSFEQSPVLMGAMLAEKIRVSHTACPECHGALRLEIELNDPRESVLGG